MTAIRPIETRYKGYRFRSRLEARWAVFFDAMDWQWRYEPEGFPLTGEGWYLPDFWVDWPLDAFLEIKPNHDAARADRAQEKCHELFVQSGYKTTMVAMGEPYPKAYWVTVFSARIGEIVNGWLADGFTCRGIWIQMFEGGDVPLTCPPDCGDCCGVALPLKAYNAARSARFEHSEQG